MAKSPSAPPEVFLNLPYDKKFEKLFLAYISGIAAFGFAPRATLEIRKSTDRLDKILGLIQACQYSIHDLSRVELDRRVPRTPRFNMPFELGLSVACTRLAKDHQRQWFVCESVTRRLQKSLSDLNGIHPRIHDGRVGDIFVELRNMFVKPFRQPSVQEMWAIYRDLRKSRAGILKQAGARSVFSPSIFRQLCIVANESADKHLS